MMRETKYEVNFGWRQGEYLIKKLKRLLRIIESMRKQLRKLKGEKKKSSEKRFKKLHREYLSLCRLLISRTENSFESGLLSTEAAIVQVQYFVSHAERQINQIERRVLNGETIPHEEKVFSIFEPHTEWITKGKSGVPQELGIKVAIVQDQHRFILHHAVMEKTEDAEIAVELMLDSLSKYSSIVRCSFDKGYYSEESKEFLNDIVETVIMPAKGHPAPEESEIEYKKMRTQHATVESAINCLGHHGLDRVLDFGIHGLRRYVSLSVLSYNIHKLGNLVRPKLATRKVLKAA